MIGSKFVPLLAAVSAVGLAAEDRAPSGNGPLPADSALLAQALTGPALDLTMRGTTVTVVATATTAEGGCAAQVSAHAPGRDRRWSRLFRWSEMAWSGTDAQGRTKVAFYDQEGRLAVDTFAVRPADAASFREALARTSAACRLRHGEGERIMAATDRAADRSCYVARLPSLQIHEAVAGQPQRATLSILSRENPQAELQLLLERAAPNAAGGDDWGRPDVSFVFGDPRLEDLRIAAAGFALDDRALNPRHSIAAYGDTRLRISMDPKRESRGPGGTSFYRRLKDSEDATLILYDKVRQSRAVLHFDTGSVLEAARKALKTVNWSCSGAAPAPPAASTWQRAD